VQSEGNVVDHKVDGADEGALIRELLPHLLHKTSTIEVKLGSSQGFPASSLERRLTSTFIKLNT
jgi:hypothetical protein